MTHKFTLPVFIRKNTVELRKKLEELGYKQVENGVDERHIQMSKLPYLETGYDNRVGNYFVGENGYWHTCAIDCGTNEDLFLALAALREDTDKGQWFVMDIEIYTNIPQGTWFRATDMNGGRHIGTQIDSLYCHKATVEEIVEHFKD